MDEFAQYFMDDERKSAQTNWAHLKIDSLFMRFFTCFNVILDIVFYSPFFPHALEAWARRSHPNMLFLFYEDMKRVN